jgi:MFS family permease
LLKPYRELFAVRGAIGFSAAAFVGRLPSAMLGLAVILGISKTTGSYADAGAVGASAMLGLALGAPLSGRLVDRHGQRRVLLSFAILHSLGMSALIAAAELRAPLRVLCVAGVVAGASRLSVGTLARTRWAYALRSAGGEGRAAALLTAYAFESVLDEVVFISGPILATLLCTAVHPFAGLACCLALSVVGSMALAGQRTTEPPVEPAPRRREFALAIPGMLVICASTVCLGVSAGAIDVAVVARADAFGSRGLSGVLLATLALSSMLAGSWYGARPWRVAPHALWIRCLLVLVCGLVPFAFAASAAHLALAMFVAGLAIAPTSIAGMVLAERLLPARVLNEGMSVCMTAMALGIAAGGWLCGVLVDRGAQGAIPIPVAAASAALVIAASCSRWLAARESLAPSRTP